jgi:hypothetical protein
MARMDMPKIAPPNTHANTMELTAVELMVVSVLASLQNACRDVR